MTIITLSVLAAAYPNSDTRNTLTHAVEIDAAGEPIRVLCGRVKIEHICPEPSAIANPGGPPSCAACAKRLAKIKAEEKLADLRQNDGFIAAAPTALDGGWNTVYDAEAQGCDPSEGGKYVIICENHASIVQFTSKRDALAHLKTPDFCDCCRKQCGTEWSACPTCGRKGGD